MAMPMAMVTASAHGHSCGQSPGWADGAISLGMAKAYPLKSIRITIRKCVQERKIDPDPTHQTSFDNDKTKTPNTDWSKICISRVFVAIFCSFCWSVHLKAKQGPWAPWAEAWTKFPNWQYKAQTDYTKPRQTIQSHKKTIQSPWISDKTSKY